MVRGILDYRRLKQAERPERIPIKPVSFVVLLVALLYTFLLPWVGFLLGTPLLVFVLFKLLGGEKWWQGVILSACVTAILWWFFRIYLHVALPMGFLEEFWG